MKNIKNIYLAVFICLCLVPLVSTPISGMQGAESADSGKTLPKIFENGKINTDYLSELGEFFSFNFGFRQEMVTAQGYLQTGLFSTSSQESVVAGKGDWLFYSSTMDDYVGKAALTDLQLSEIVYNLSITEENLRSEGREFVFTVAPNKNSLYPQFMPDGYVISEGTGDMDRLSLLLKESKVNYVDLFELFSSEENIRYHSTDSHWDNIGASMAMDALLSAADKEHTRYLPEEFEVRRDHIGDLYGMVYPKGLFREDEYYPKDGFSYSYKKEIKSTYDPEIRTENDGRQGTVVMFRDSFGNSLLPFVAEEYGQGFFSRGVPYEMYMASALDADTVIIEVVERNIRFLSQSAPVLAAKEAELPVIPESRDDTYKGSLTASDKDFTVDGNDYHYLKLTGRMDRDRTNASTKTYILLESETGSLVFPAYHTCESDALEEDAPYGLCCYLDLESIPKGSYEVSILSDDGGNLTLSEKYLSFENSFGTEEKGQEDEKGEDAADPKATAESYVGESIEALKKVLGSPDSESISPGCNATGGDDGIFKWGDVTVYTSSVDPGGEQIIIFVEE